MSSGVASFIAANSLLETNHASITRVAWLQFLQPIKFGNIFLGISGFHLEKVIIACWGKYLKECVVKNVLAENEIYEPNTIHSVMSGSHYVRGKRE